ncbi:ABC transporter permease/M1 family aminopeptidase [Brevundimonas sp.]|uniref:ABC transporter permease/M1 family aminopeptidase n=1 Tax=Brevundimonas sp. TaxID=1871086 RepID=UPI0035AE1C81
MFFKIAAFEFRYQLKQPAFWVICILFGLMGFGLIAASENISLGGGGNTHVNAPYAISVANQVFNVFFMLATAAIVANAVARDTQTGFGPLIHATRISKFDYVYGRFFGAFAVAALAYLSISLGMMLGTVMPWVDSETLGAFRPLDYLYAYGVFGLTGLFFTSSVLFALATATRSMMATYVGVVGLIIAYLVAGGTLGSRPELIDISAWVEPFGSAAYGLVSRYWTPEERNTLNPELVGVLLYNRLLWTGIGLVFLAGAYALFSPSARGAKAKKEDKLRKMAETAPKAAPVAVRSARLPDTRHDLKTAWAQLTARTRFEMALIFKSPAYLVLILLGAAFAFANLVFSGEVYGTPSIPVTRAVIGTLEGAFGLITVIIAIYYAGELVWRDRDRKVHEIVDASSAPDWTFLLPKTLALALVLASTLIVAMIAGIIWQTIRGNFDYQLGQYLYWYVWRQTISMSLLAALAIFIQAMSPNKFVGWALMVVYLIATIVLGNLGFDHYLYNYGVGPGVPLSDLNGAGDFIGFEAVTNAYWGAFAILLLVVTFALWRRGTETRFKPRLKRAPQRLKGPAGVIAGLALVAFVGLGAFVFVSTNVWNDYRSRDDSELRLANMEKALLQYEDTPQPAVVDVTLDLDLYPHAPRLETTGRYVIQNKTGAPLPAVHLRWIEDLDVTRLDVQGATIEREWPDYQYRIYRFDQPMQPGERRTIDFQTVRYQRGFTNGGNLTSIVDNGTFINNGGFAIDIGMDRGGLLTDRTKRRKFGLPAELRMRDLNDPEGLTENYIGVDWVNADITLTTDADQTPIAPGYKVSDVTTGDRRTARFVTEAPILHFFSVQSADYDITREIHDGVALEIYHHPDHDQNVQRMIDALKAGLDYMQPAFGDYQFRQARIIEFPAYASFAQAFANTMPYSEDIGFIADLRNPDKIDYVSFVTVHELGHQWWAHQIVGANVQGATTLSETLAEYSALMVMEKLYGPDQIRRFLKYDLDTYLRSRGSERLGEFPLVRVEAGQGYIHYQKGGHVLYLLRDQLGEEAVNAALRSLLEAHKFGEAPYPRSVDLIAAIRAQAPASKQALITDLFERITLYDVKVTEAEATRLPNGRWDVELTVEARKLYADAQGVETEAPLNETMEIGLFTAEPGRGVFDQEDVILMERRPIRSGTQTFRFVTSQEPKFGGVDPYNKWIDRNSDDNVEAIG